MIKKKLNLEEAYFNYRQAAIYSNWQKANLEMEKLIEKVLFYDTNKLEYFFDEQNKEDIMGLPYWLRLLIVRILVLQRPDDSELLSKVISNIEMFVGEGPVFLTEMKNRLAYLNEQNK